MGSFFNGGSRNKPRYERLPLDTFYPLDNTRSTKLDDIDDDNLLFESSQNGQLLPSAKSGYDSDEEIEFYRDNRRSPSRQRGRCCVVSLRSLLCLLVLMVAVIAFFSTVYFVPSQILCKKQKEWSSQNYEYASESAIRLYDVNSDGVQDVLVGVTTASSPTDIEYEEEFCKKKGKTYPCVGAVIALDGCNGNELWTVWTNVEIYALQCGKLDINQDGHTDCIAAGRMGGLYALDPVQGQILWTVDPSVTNPRSNFYQGQVVPDLDQDGVEDFVVTHGGDTRLSDTDMNRPAGRLILLSGKTGKSLGQYLTLPDGHETYSSITLYQRQNKAIYLLFGSGGETIAGSLWTVSLRDLYCYVMSIDLCDADHLGHVKPLQIKGYDDPWGSPIQILPSGAIEILRSGSSKGVTVPTALVDMNNDGVDDLIVLMYNSTLIVLNGINLKVMWSTGQRFAGLETYSNPAPGYFNEDDTLDLMVRLSKGRWPDFNTTFVYILDGRNGEILWHLVMPAAVDSPIMSSPLTLRSSDHKDAFLFWVQGIQRSMDSVVKALPKRRKHHGDEIDRQQPCQRDMRMYHANLLLMDWDLVSKPFGLATMDASLYNYTLTEEDRINVVDESHDDQESVPTIFNASPSQSELPTTEAVTQEDIARHNLHRQRTTGTPVDQGSTTVAITSPGGIDTTTEAVTIPQSIEPTTHIANKEQGSTTLAITSSEGIDKTKAVTTPQGIQPTTPIAFKEQVSTTLAITLPEGIDTTTKAVTTPQDIEPSTPIANEEQGSTTLAITSPEGIDTTTKAVTTPQDIEPSTPIANEEQGSTTIAITSPEGTGTTTKAVYTTPQNIEPSTPVANKEQGSTTLAITSSEGIDTTPVDIEPSTPVANKEMGTTDFVKDNVRTSTDDSQTSSSEIMPSSPKTTATTPVESVISTSTLAAITVLDDDFKLTARESEATTSNPDTSKPVQTTRNQITFSPTTKPNVLSMSSDSHRQKREKPGGDSCTVYVPTLFGTGIIDDLDHDGNLDYIYTESHLAQLHDSGSYLQTKLKLTVHKLDLNSAIKRQDLVMLGNQVGEEKLKKHFKFLPVEKQSWNSYMGKDADGKFKNER